MAILQATTDANGAFDIPGAVSGKYALYVGVGPAHGGSMTSAEFHIGLRSAGSRASPFEVEVGIEDLNDLRLSIPNQFEATGRVVIEGRASKVDDPDLMATRVTLVPEDEPFFFSRVNQPSNREGQPSSAGAFTFRRISPGAYRVQISGLPSGGYVRSIQMGSLDILSNGLNLQGASENPIEIIIGMNAGSVSGVVLNGNGGKAQNAVVGLVPDGISLEKRLDLYRSTNTDAEGRFLFSTTPPGNYRLFAVDYAPQGIGIEADFFEPLLASATVVIVGEHGNESVTLTLGK
jgi:hypothetical protein